MNLGFKCAEGRYICLISDDSVIHPDTLANGVRHFEREIASGRRLGARGFLLAFVARGEEVSGQLDARQQDDGQSRPVPA